MLNLHSPSTNLPMNFFSFFRETKLFSSPVNFVWEWVEHSLHQISFHLFTAKKEKEKRMSDVKKRETVEDPMKHVRQNPGKYDHSLAELRHCSICWYIGKALPRSFITSYSIYMPIYWESIAKKFNYSSTNDDSSSLLHISFVHSSGHFPLKLLLTVLAPSL